MLDAIAFAFVSFLVPPAKECPAFEPAAESLPAAHYTTQVLFANRTSWQRREWGLATVPFPESTWDGVAPYTAVGHRCELVPFGARWPDGSVRQAQLAVYLDLQPFEERLVTIAPGVADAGSFVTSPWVEHAGSNFTLQLIAKLSGQSAQVATLGLRAVERTSGARRAYWLQGRVPGCNLACDLWITQWSDQDTVSFELRVTASDVTSTTWFEDYESIDLLATGVFPYVRGGARRGVQYQNVSNTGPTLVHLLQNQRLFDGQGHEWFGELIAFHPQVVVPPDAGLRVSTLVAQIGQSLFGCSQDWAATGAFGPFGVVPAAPPWITDGGRQLAIMAWLSHVDWSTTQGGYWEDMPLGLLPNAGTTGEQPDFGAAKMVDIVSSGAPDRIEEARYACSEEANRPVHHREADGSALTSASHPDWVAWSGRSHFNPNVCSDRLGKPWPEPYMAFNGWAPKDHQHWSSLTLATTYLLTGSYSLREELNNEVEIYLASHTIPSMKPNWSTNSIDQPRAIGRTFLSLSWNYLLTGREDLRTRLAARARECVKPQCIGLRVNGQVKPIVVSAPDIRVIPLYDFWKPWEEALAVVGLEACFRVTGEPAAREIAEIAAWNLAFHGWKVDQTECVIATGIKWNADGSALTPAELQDPDKVLWSYGTDFSLWALGAMRLSRYYAELWNDTTWMNRAQLIVDRISIGRTPPRGNGWDRFADWWPVLD